MIHKYIKELVENNNRVIIPDFGAFMVQSTAEGKQISFNDFLKFNDGLLVNQIIKSEKTSKNEATEQIKTFIKNIDETFSNGKPYEIKDVGFLVKDDHGNIKFNVKGAGEKSSVLPTDEKPTIILDEKKEVTEAKPEIKKPVAKPKETIKTTPKVEVKAEPKAEPKKEIKKTITESKPTPQQTQKTTKVVEKPLAKTSDKKSAESIAASIMDKKKKTNSNGFFAENKKLVIIIAALVIVLGGGTWAVISFDLLSKPEPVVEVIALEPIIDTVPEVDTVKVIEEEQPTVIEEPAVDPNVKHYYIVAGSFKVASNADNYNQKLINEGYDSEIVERSNGYYTVSYKTIYDWSEALREWRTMRNTNSETWILVK